MSRKTKVLNLFGDSEIQPSSGDKYSDLLNSFVQPFEHRFPKDYLWEDVLQFGTEAWNLATMEQFLPPEEVRRAEAHKDMPEPERTIMKQMIRKKSTQFAKYDRFIVDFDLADTSDDKNKLTVVTQEKEAFFEDMMRELEEIGFEGDNYRPGYIDRLALTMTAQQPFFDWVKSVYPDNRMEAKNQKSHVYLLYEGINDPDTYIRKQFDIYFESELEAFEIYEENWPAKRSFKMFQEWFHFSFSSLVYDMENQPIYKD